MSDMNAVVKMQNAVALNPLRPTTFAEMERFAERAARSGMVPKDYMNRPDAILIAVQMGTEVGLAPMQALQSISVINGRPSIWGDAVVGLVRNSGLCQSIAETVTGEGEARVAKCVAIRVGEPAIERTFSVADAKKAGLWGKAGPWQQYPDRMLSMRARGFALRDGFADVLRGLITSEEAQDIPNEPPRREPPHAGPTIETHAEPQVNDTTTARALGDGIPALDAKPKKQTVQQFLDALDIELAHAQDAEAMDAILARMDVQSAQDRLTNGARDRLQAMLDAALKRTAAPVDDDGFPGDVT
jgi:hypothetical protein